jgi:hypothetical protein
MRIEEVTECRGCPFNHDDNYGGSYCDADYINAPEELSPPESFRAIDNITGFPDWCPLLTSAIIVKLIRP